MGRSEGYKSKDVGPVMFRKHANEILHCYESDPKMRKSRTLWSLFTTGMQFALNQWLKTQNKALLSFQYPGSSAAAQRKFATLETEAGINARHEFHVQWLKDFLQRFSAQDQRAVLRVIAELLWRMP